jgi:hypothetical protein
MCDERDALYDRLAIFEQGRAAGRAESSHEGRGRLTAALITGGFGVVAAVFTGVSVWDQKNQDVAAIRADIRNAGGCAEMRDVERRITEVNEDTQVIYKKTHEIWAMLEILRRGEDEEADPPR